MRILPLLALAALGLAACNQPNTAAVTGPAPSGGSAGAMGDAYCETVPTNPEDMTQWNELCQAGGRGR
jgi:hypothetical protein